MTVAEQALKEIEESNKRYINAMIDSINGELEERRKSYLVAIDYEPKLRIYKVTGEKKVTMSYPVNIVTAKNFLEGVVCALEEMDL